MQGMRCRSTSVGNRFRGWDGRLRFDKKTQEGWFEQLWFAGNHSDVGGSYSENESRLSDISLQWMLEEAVKAGLKYDLSVLKLFPDPFGPQHDETRSSLFRLAPKLTRAIPHDAPLHPSVLERFPAAEVSITIPLSGTDPRIFATTMR